MGERLSKIKELGVDSVILNFGEVVSVDSVAVFEIASAVESGMNIRIIHPIIDCAAFLQKSNCQADIYYNEADARRSIREAKSRLKEQNEQNWGETNLPATFVISGKSIRGTLLKVTQGVAFLALNDPISGKDLSGSITVAVNSKKFGKLNIAGTVQWTRKIGKMYNVGVKILL
ncbi:MAG: hypothetical protein HZA19_06340 [Nitrospirae bacterium]|nr:hypothetical protein [Nitrospirota bacterium]